MTDIENIYQIRIAVMDGLVPFDPPDEHTSAHARIIKWLLDMQDGINACILTEQRLTISFIIYAVNDKSYLFLIIDDTASWDYW